VHDTWVISLTRIANQGYFINVDTESDQGVGLRRMLRISIASTGLWTN
jgi:hypothetical protein